MRLIRTYQSTLCAGPLSLHTKLLCNVHNLVLRSINSSTLKDLLMYLPIHLKVSDKVVVYIEIVLLLVSDIVSTDDTGFQVTPWGGRTPCFNYVQ